MDKRQAQADGDLISRQATIDAFKPRRIAENVWQECHEYKVLSSLPSVNPQPTGHRKYISVDTVIEWLKEEDIIKMSWQEDNARKELEKLEGVAIPSAEPKDSEDKIIRRTLENFMRGLWEEIQVGELEYTTSEVYEMLEREIFTDNHVAIPSAEPRYYPPCEDCHKKMNEIRKAYDKIQSAEPKTGHWEHIRCDMYECSECQHIYTDLSGEKQGMNFCPNCGCHMVEPQESEG